MNFAELPAQVYPLIGLLKRLLIDVLENNSPKYANNLFANFRRLANVIAENETSGVSEITENHIANYIGHYSVNDKLGLESQLSALLNRWIKLNLPGVSTAAIQLLNSRKKPGNVKGEAVLTLDPVSGPLSDYELQLLTTKLNEAYAIKKLDEPSFFLSWLAILTGQRVSQYCALKVKDLRRGEDEFGEVSYEIMIPQAKQRGESTRDSFLCRPLNRHFADDLWRYCEQIRSEFSQQGEDAPMFPSWRRRSDGLQLNASFSGHYTSAELATEFKEALAAITPISPRTSEPMNLTIGRFRDTLGTRSAQEGLGELVIAEILGHADTQNVRVYVAAIPDIAPRLDKKLSQDLAPIANAFLGKILVQPGDATRADDTASNIIDYRYAKAGVGNCGTTSDCRFNAPIACYTCCNFEAWLDAPHETLLEHLIAEREQLLSTSGPRIAAINDLTIIAVQRVVDECRRIKLAVEMRGPK